MNNRSLPWQIAADLETAAKAVKEAEFRLSLVHSTAWDAMHEDESVSLFVTESERIARALQALSGKYQAIADAEETT